MSTSCFITARATCEYTGNALEIFQISVEILHLPCIVYSNIQWNRMRCQSLLSNNIKITVSDRTIFDVCTHFVSILAAYG